MTLRFGPNSKARAGTAEMAPDQGDSPNDKALLSNLPARTSTNALSAISRGAEWYSSRPAIRALVVAIPSLGGAIDVALSTDAARTVEKRLTRFMEVLSEECDTLDEEKLDKTFVGSDDWTDAVLGTFQAATRAGSEEKLRIYARILIGAATNPDPKTPEPSALVAALEDLSGIEITLARHFAQMGGSIRSDEMGQYRRVVDANHWQRFLKGIPEEAKPNWLFHVKRLERSGLISEVTGTLGGPGMYEPTPTLWRILSYLADTAGGLHRKQEQKAH